MHMHGHTMPHPGWKCVEPPSDLQAIGLNMAGLDSAVGAGCDSAHGTLGSSHRSNHRRWELLTKDSIESSATMCYCSSGAWDTLRILVKPWFARSKTICMLIETNSLSSQLISALGSLRGLGKMEPTRWYRAGFASLTSHAAGIVGFVGFQKIVVARSGRVGSPGICPGWNLKTRNLSFPSSQGSL